jgi:hypothetical protein
MKATYNAINALLVAVAMGGQAMAADPTPPAAEANRSAVPSTAPSAAKKPHTGMHHQSRARHHDNAVQPPKS